MDSSTKVASLVLENNYLHTYVPLGQEGLIIVYCRSYLKFLYKFYFIFLSCFTNFINQKKLMCFLVAIWTLENNSLIPISHLVAEIYQHRCVIYIRVQLTLYQSPLGAVRSNNYSLHFSVQLEYIKQDEEIQCCKIYLIFNRCIIYIRAQLTLFASHSTQLKLIAVSLAYQSPVGAVRSR
jgi:hypothetical protein